MEVFYTLTPDDLRRVWQWKVAPAKIIARAFFVFALISCLSGVIDAAHDFGFGVAIACVLLLLLFFLPISLLRYRWSHQRKVQEALVENPHQVGPRRVRLEREGLYYGRQTSGAVYPWHDLGRPRRNAHYFLIDAIGVGTIPIPLRAFAGRVDAELFWTALLAYKMSGGGAEVVYAADETVWPPPPTSGSSGIGG